MKRLQQHTCLRPQAAAFLLLICRQTVTELLTSLKGIPLHFPGDTLLF
jgi:hypothetical protein